jgi:methanogenic corrinoid protein MtbC1
MSDKAILDKLKQSILNFDEEAAIKAANEAINEGIDPLEAIKNGLYPGLKKIADQYEQTVYITDMILASDAFYAGANILKSKIAPEELKANSKGIAVLGVVKGDVHDLGKNMVKYLFEAEGFEIIDLGFDVPAEKFVDEAEKSKAKFILVSVMLSSMFPEIGKIVELAKQRNLQAKGVKIMAGGGPVTEKIALQQGADGWALTAPLAVKKALDLLR